MATYMELKKLYNTDGHLVSAALNVLYTLGAEALRDNPPTVDEVANGNPFDKKFLEVLLTLGVKAFKSNPPTADEVAGNYSDDFAQRVVDVAAILADTDNDTLWAVIRSLIIPETRLKNSDEICPICGSHLSVDVSALEKNWSNGFVLWKCEVCHAQGESDYMTNDYRLDFIGHCDVIDGDGNPIGPQYAPYNPDEDDVEDDENL